MSAVRLPAMKVSGTLLGFDFGEKRVGVAVGETGTGLAHPIGTIDEEGTQARFDALAKLVSTWQPVGFVVGLPHHPGGEEHEVARLAGKFARRLQTRFGLPVAFVDESLSSVEAAARLRDAGDRGHRKGQLDAHAATVILQSYLDELSRADAKGAHGHAAA